MKFLWGERVKKCESSIRLRLGKLRQIEFFIRQYRNDFSNQTKICLTAWLDNVISVKKLDLWLDNW